MKKTKLAVIFTSLILVMSIAGSLLFVNNISGAIRLFKTAITLNFKDNVYTYNDQALEGLNYTISDGSLFSGDKLKFTFKSEIKNAGTYNRDYFNYSIISQTGKDVTSSYIINENFEDIVINKRELNIVTSSAVGTVKFFQEGYADFKHATIKSGNLCEGHFMEASKFRTIFYAGTFENTCNITIKNSSNQVVTTNYDISIYPGTLFIIGTGSGTGAGEEIDIPHAPDEDASDSGSIGLDSDKENKKEEYSDQLLDLNYPVFQYYKYTEGNHFLRDNASNGSYNINVFEKSPRYQITEDNINPDEYITFLLKDKVSEHSGIIDYSLIKSRNYDFHLNYPIYDIKQDNDLYPILSDLKTNKLAVKGLNYDYMSNPSLLDDIEIDNGQFIKEETKYREFVYSNYLSMDSYNYDFIKNYIEEHNLKGNSVYEIANKLIKLFSTEFKYSMQNLECYKEKYQIISFLRDTKIGKCTEFATSSTLIFRALGYPARVITGYSVDGIGKVDVLAKYAHAKTQVYFDYKGWVDFEFTVAPSIDENEPNPWGGQDKDDKDDEDEDYEIKISSESLTKEYDRTTLSSNNFSVEGEENLKNGHKLYAFCNNSILDAGFIKNTVNYFILDSNFNDVTSEYKVKEDFGYLMITQKKFEVSTQNCKVDFNDQFKGRDKIIYDSSDLIAGDYVSLDFFISFAERGTYDNIVVIKIFNEDGKDVTSNYDIKYNYGKLEVL